MINKTLFIVAGLSVLVGFVLSCGQTKKVETNGFSKVAMQGKQIFEDNKCNTCHYIGDEAVEADAPDLTNPLLANDSMFVRAHLTFIEASQMPPIEMTDEENRLLGHFIAELHASKQTVISTDESDAICPVCYAPVSMQQAIAEKLTTKMLGETYYFECDKCKRTFRKAPEAFIELLNQHQLVTLSKE